MRTEKIKVDQFKKLQLDTKSQIQIKGGRGPVVDPYG